MNTLLAVVLAVVVICTARAQLSCPSFTSCSACIPVYPCGWCDQTSSCVNGTSTGPIQGTCPSWRWTSCGITTTPMTVPPTTNAPMGTDRCNLFASSCYTCVAQGSCGYCMSSGMCQTGGSTGPLQGSCARWAWLSNQCATQVPTMTPAPGVTNICSQFTSCNTCTLNGPCGWCPATMSCMQGTGVGPSNGTCPNWQWTVNLCATQAPTPNPAMCATHTQCSNCTLHGGCGWCAASKTCSAGSSSGPAFGTCSVWAWTDLQCPSPFAVKDLPRGAIPLKKQH